MLPGTGIRQCMAGGCMATAPDAPAATTAARAAADSVASPFKVHSMLQQLPSDMFCSISRRH